jgi:hypothetical protein
MRQSKHLRPPRLCRVVHAKKHDHKTTGDALDASNMLIELQRRKDHTKWFGAQCQRCRIYPTVCTLSSSVIRCEFVRDLQTTVSSKDGAVSVLASWLN